jgi:hypothetical protein
VFTTGRTGCTSNNESFELGRRELGVGCGSGRSNGSDAGFSALAVVLEVCLVARRGLVDCAWITDAASKQATPTLKSRATKVDLFMVVRLYSGEDRFESSDRFREPSDAA